MKIRPIVSNINSPTTKISWFLSSILKPLLDEVPAHLQSSDVLVNKLKNLNSATVKEFPYPFSLDVVALYTSIPIADAVENVKMIMEASRFKYKSLTTDDIGELLLAVFTNTYLQFNNKIFLQVKGLAMGSNVSPILAILFMDTLERRVLNVSRSISTYCRYVDDIFMLTTNKDSATNIHTQMNSLHPAIEFEIEHPTTNNTLSLLDIEVKINVQDGSICMEHFKKKAKKDVFLNFNTALPASTKKKHCHK